MNFLHNSWSRSEALKYLMQVLIVTSFLQCSYCTNLKHLTNREEPEEVAFVVGSDAAAAGIKWNVAVGLSDGTGFKFLCGGVVTSPTKVITSASCFEPESHNITFHLSQIQVLDKNQVFHNVESVTLHPNHTKENKYNDIASLKLGQVFTDIKVLIFPREVNPRNYYGKKEGQYVSNWIFGTNNSNVHPTSDIKRGTIIDNEICEAEYKEYFRRKSLDFYANFPKGIQKEYLICVHVTGVQQCERKPGYQLAHPEFNIIAAEFDFEDLEFEFLLGTRFDDIPKNSTDCDLIELPALFTNVGPHKAWIESV